LRNLKEKCYGEPGNTQFWPHVQKEGLSLSLISDVEAAKHGGRSAISGLEVKKVCSKRVG
jgi:ATP-dependent DNA helicase 2 subunit 2